MIPIRRILLRTVSSILGVKSYVPQRKFNEGRNAWGAYLSSIKMARNTFWWFPLPGNSMRASSSKPWILAILLWFSSILVFGTFFTPTFLAKTGPLRGSVVFLGMLKFFLFLMKGMKKTFLHWKPCDSVGSVRSKAHWTAWGPLRAAFYMVLPALYMDLLGGQNALQSLAFPISIILASFSTVRIEITYFLCLFSNFNAFFGNLESLLPELWPE